MSTQRLSANRSHIAGDNLLQFPSAKPNAELLESEQMTEQKTQNTSFQLVTDYK